MVTEVYLEGFRSPKHALLLDLLGGFMGFCFGVLLNSINEFPDSSVGKESACNAGDPILIPELGRSPGEGKGYPLQYSWASLVVQLVKNLPAIWETWVPSLGWEDPLEKGRATHSSTGLENSLDYSPWAFKESDMTEHLSLHSIFNTSLRTTSFPPLPS